MKKYLLGFYKKDYDFTSEDGKQKSGTSYYAVIGQMIPENSGKGLTPCVYKYSPKYLSVEGASSLSDMLNHQVYIDSHCFEGAKLATLDSITLVVEK